MIKNKLLLQKRCVCERPKEQVRKILWTCDIILSIKMTSKRKKNTAMSAQINEQTIMR